MRPNMRYSQYDLYEQRGFKELTREIFCGFDGDFSHVSEKKKEKCRKRLGEAVYYDQIFPKKPNKCENCLGDGRNTLYVPGTPPRRRGVRQRTTQSKVADIQGHHFNYNHFLNIVWLCQRCHDLIHKPPYRCMCGIGMDRLYCEYFCGEVTDSFCFKSAIQSGYTHTECEGFIQPGNDPTMCFSSLVCEDCCKSER